ncbi:MAG: UPF0262 family protein [Rickettsiales bacterium]|nr:UPF0262 family protein [Rickettsiales bacterium]
MENRVEQITLDPAIYGYEGSDKHQNATNVIREIIKEHCFKLHNNEYRGNYIISLSSSEGNLLIITHDSSSKLLDNLVLPMRPLKKIIKDYSIICESYNQAIEASYSPSKIEAIDMGRRGLHNEGAELIIDLLEEKVQLDFDTARKLFTLVHVLFVRG